MILSPAVCWRTPRLGFMAALPSGNSSPFCLFVLIFRDRVSLCSLGYPGSLSVDQVGLELKNLPASAPQALGLKTCATTAQGPYDFLHNVQSYQQHHKQISGYHLCPPKLQETPLKKS